jgi:hypothetical protein
MHVAFDARAPSSSDPAIVNIADSLRAAIAGGEAARALSASAALFEAGGRHVLSEGAKRAVREVAERGASRAIAMTTGPILESAAQLASKPLLAMSSKAGAALGVKSAAASGAANASKMVAAGVGKQAMRMAGTQILKGAGKAAGIGFVLDGAIAGVEAVVAVRNGSTDKRSAAIHVAKEATTGAIATGAGVLLGAGLVALTGGIAAPVVFAVGALGSIGAKRLLRRVVRSDQSPLTTTGSARSTAAPSPT